MQLSLLRLGWYKGTLVIVRTCKKTLLTKVDTVNLEHKSVYIRIFQSGRDYPVTHTMVEAGWGL